MAKTQLIQAIPQGQNPQVGSPGAAVRGVGPLDTSVVFGQIGGSIDSVREEIDDAYKDMKTLHNEEPDRAMRMTSGHSARLSEIRVRIMRIEDFHPQWRNVRTREIEPTLEELERQWRNASRLHSVRELDWKMESGER